MRSAVQTLLGNSHEIDQVRQRIQLVAPRSTPVLIQGESGTETRQAAELIHQLSDRRDHPLIVVNCASIPEGVLDSELFGVERGTFTGAVTTRVGRIEAADGGTLVLEDVDTVPTNFQMRLLRFLQTGEITPIGIPKARKADVRLVATTSQNLASLVISGAIRPDLYYKLAVFLIRIPPLRERKEDIPILALSYLASIAPEYRSGKTLGADAIRTLTEYTFPGNIDELKNILQGATIRQASGASIDDELIVLVTSRKLEQKSNKLADREHVTHLQRTIDGLVAERDALKATSIRAQPIWQGRGFSTWQDYCFTLMPFGEEFQLQSVYRDHVKPVVGRCGLRCERADDIYDISGVMQSVWEGINRARLIIADLTGRNPNVFYELGIAHTLGKPVVMITQSIDYVPFDLRHLRCYVYEYTPPGVLKLEAALERTIRNLLSNSADLTL